MAQPSKRRSTPAAGNRPHVAAVSDDTKRLVRSGGARVSIASLRRRSGSGRRQVVFAHDRNQPALAALEMLTHSSRLALNEGMDSVALAVMVASAMSGFRNRA